MKAIRAIFKWVDKASMWLAVLALIMTFALVFLNVIMRYVFGSGFAWSEEGARYALMAVIIMGALEVTHDRGHFYVDLLTNAAPKPLLRVLHLLQDALMMGVMGVMAKGSFEMTLLNWENKTPAIGMPSWIPYGLMFATSVVSLAYLAGHLLEDCGLSLHEQNAEEGDDHAC